MNFCFVNFFSVCKQAEYVIFDVVDVAGNFLINHF